MNRTSKLELGWMTFDKLSELTGLSVESLRAHKKKGHFREKYHWTKNKGRLFIHYERLQEWIEGKRQTYTQE